MDTHRHIYAHIWTHARIWTSAQIWAYMDKCKTGKNWVNSALQNKTSLLCDRTQVQGAAKLNICLFSTGFFLLNFPHRHVQIVQPKYLWQISAMAAAHIYESGKATQVKCLATEVDIMYYRGRIMQWDGLNEKLEDGQNFQKIQLRELNQCKW